MLLSGCAQTFDTTTNFLSSPWKKKPEELLNVKTPDDRVKELKELAKAAKKKTPEEQQRNSDELAREIQKESDPMLRRQILRTLAEGVRVFAVSIVVSIVLVEPAYERLGWNFLRGGAGEVASIFVIVCLTLFYTFEGGMTAVIWTDVVQTVIYVGGTLVGLFTILHLVPGGWPVIHSLAESAGKLRVFDFTPDFWKPYTFWAGLIGGTFFTLASHGTDQLIVQRLLAARNQRQSATALLSSGVAIFFLFTLFLTIGVMLFGFYQVPSASFGKADRIYPTFIISQMPHGISGLLIAAILAAAMSNLSAALNSLASTTVLDLWKPILGGTQLGSASDATWLARSRYTTVVWGIVLMGVALLARQWGNVLQAGLSIASIVYGSLLGVFLLGLFTRRVGEIAAMCGMSVGLVLLLYVRFATPIAFTWYVMIGASATFATAVLVSLVIKEPAHGA